MERLEIFENYKKSLNQKYNAVCFDIDGTLTIKDSKNIDYRAIEMISKLLIRKIPVVFITGRGEVGLNDLKKDIYEPLKSIPTISDNDLKRMFVLTNDGARLFYSENISKIDFLNKNIYVSTEQEFKQLVVFDDLIAKVIKNNGWYNYFDVSYSKDLKTGSIINIRLVLKDKYNDINNYLFRYFEKLIKKNDYTSLHLTRGVFKNKYVIQIGTATKDMAINRAEKIIGVPVDSMIRIGDCGDYCGNDFAMLDCNQGYSVDKTSGKVNSCFPIFNESQEILTGVDATLYLVKNAKILPTVCLEKIDKNYYTKKYAKVVEGIVLGRKKLLNNYNSLINYNFDIIDGINGVFDKFSGSVKIPMYEWELLDDIPLKQMWEAKNDDCLKYSLRDDNDYLLRGSNTYYYFLSNRQSVNGKDITTKKNILEWQHNYLKFLDDSITAINRTENLDNRTNKKLVLGVLDNCRNILLVLINHMLVSKYFKDNILLNLLSEDNFEFKEIYKILYNVEFMMGKLCFDSTYMIDFDLLNNIIISTHNVLKKNLDTEYILPEKSDYSKDYRAYREIDNFCENYIAVSIYLDKNNVRNGSINACGLSYGGIELPIIAKVISMNKIDKLLLLKFNKDVSGYSNKQLIDLRKFNINDFGNIKGIEKLDNGSTHLFDDNVLTGKTLQLAINSLYDCGITVDNVCIVRYPGVNRINQMFLENHGAIDYKLFFDYINGLCFDSPYSWRDENPYSIYEDSLGVFDLNRKKIVECLIKNHDYKENSEVYTFKRRLIK